MTSSLKLFSVYFNSLLYKTNRFQVAVRLFSNRSQRTSKCGKNISDTLGCASCATFLFLPHFDVLCHLLLNRRTATWNLFVKYTIAATTFGLNVLEKKEIEKQLVFSICTVTAVVLDWFVSDWFYLDSFLQWISWFERATMGICIFFSFDPLTSKSVWLLILPTVLPINQM